MDAAVAEPVSSTIKYRGRSIESRVSVLEGTITNQDRIFDMLREGQQNLRDDIAGINTRIAAMDIRINERINETNEHITTMELALNERITTMELALNERINETNERINETNERISAMELTVNGRIAAMELTVNGRIAAMDTQLNTKIDSNLKWILGVQIAMWVTIIVAVLL
ncbi:MAG: hypothetical protein J7J06_01970 [Methanosarcinales archaeon]|nr:hypothetical protein [Methanosarcinales archaeon]